MSTVRGFFPVVFKADEDHCLLDVDPSDCELRVMIAKYEDGDGYYFLDAEVVEVSTGGSDAWYDFVDFACCPHAFESLGYDDPKCARFDGATWVFDTLLEAIIWAKRFAIDGIGVEPANS